MAVLTRAKIAKNMPENVGGDNDDDRNYDDDDDDKDEYKYISDSADNLDSEFE